MNVLLAVTPLLADINWSDLLYGLIPILYFVAQFLGNKDDKKEKKPEAVDEAERAERRRRIQDEIRRRMTGEEPPPEAAPEPAARVEPERAAPARPAGRPPRESPPRPQSKPRAAAREREAVIPPPSPAADGYGSDVERRLAEQREALARARSAREAARSQAADITQGAIGESEGQAAGSRSSLAGPSVLRQDVLRMLGSADDIRRAVILSEVLAPPVSERPPGRERVI